MSFSFVMEIKSINPRWSGWMSDVVFMTEIHFRSGFVQNIFRICYSNWLYVFLKCTMTLFSLCWIIQNANVWSRCVHNRKKNSKYSTGSNTLIISWHVMTFSCLIPGSHRWTSFVSSLRLWRDVRKEPLPNRQEETTISVLCSTRRRRLSRRSGQTCRCSRWAQTCGPWCPGREAGTDPGSGDSVRTD